MVYYLESETLKDPYNKDDFLVKIAYVDNINTAQTYHRPKWNIRKSIWSVYQENITLQLTEKLFRLTKEYTISNELEHLPQTKPFHTAKNQEKDYSVVKRRMKITMQESHHAFNRERKHLTTKNLIEFKNK